MLINKDQLNSHETKIVFHNAEATLRFAGAIERITFGSDQYQWHPTSTGGSADPDGPASKSKITADAQTTYTLPKASITVLRGRLAAK
jgi:hypothetical protein